LGLRELNRELDAARRIDCTTDAILPSLALCSSLGTANSLVNFMYPSRKVPMVGAVGFCIGKHTGLEPGAANSVCHTAAAA